MRTGRCSRTRFSGRGVAQDIWNWMQAGLLHTPSTDEQASLAGTRLCVTEGIKAGTTLFGDYSYYDGWGTFLLKLGCGRC